MLSALSDLIIQPEATSNDRATEKCLTEAAKNGDLSRVKRFSDPRRIRDIDCKSTCQSQGALNPLMEAAKSGQFEIVVYLIKSRDADVNQETRFGHNALNLAAKAGHKNVVEFLVQNGANVVKKASNSSSGLRYGVEKNALIVAYENGNVEIAKFLLDRGANCRDIWDSAKAKGDWEMISILQDLKHFETEDKSVKNVSEQIKNKENLQAKFEAAIRANQEIRMCENSKQELIRNIQDYQKKISQLKNEIGRLDKEIAMKKIQGDYLPCEALKKLKSDIDEINELQMHFSKPTEDEEVHISKECPICMLEIQTRVFCCVQCNKWICETCLESITQSQSECPSCRCDLRTQPMQRNKAIEQLLRQ